ncbi:MAG: hypothetical protein ABI954_02565 [Pyrinomonadaceae bacterium]
MKLLHSIAVYFLICLVLLISVPAIFAQEAKGALLHGYRTGYSDGYMSGYRDTTSRAARDFTKHSDYAKADRVYRNEYGSLEEYRDGYQQGFETGYGSGFDRREFDSALPANLSRRAAPKTVVSQQSVENIVTGNKSDAPSLQDNSANADLQSSNGTLNSLSGQPTIIIPNNTEIVVEMLGDVNTENSREGDLFLARIVAPEEVKGATIEGRVTKIKKPGRVKGSAELQLSFSRIVLNENRWANFNAVVIEALPMKDSNIKAIDSEGTVQGKSSLKSDAVKVGAASGTGAVVGAIAGGPVGAVIGATVGGAFGVGGVLVARGKDINLTQGQQIRVRTNFESQIR